MKAYRSVAAGLAQPSTASLAKATGAYGAFVSAGGIALATLLLAAVATAAPADALQDQATKPDYEFFTPSRDGIGKRYMGREIARVMGHQGAGWLERSQREREERTDLLIAALGLNPGDVVADVGAGTGYFAFRMSPLVPQGKVFAVDIQLEMLDIIRSRMDESTGNIMPVLGNDQDVRLPPGSIDLILLVDAYHEFSHPREVMQAIAASLSDRGRVVLVEYRGEDPEVPIKALHKMTVEQARRELGEVGLSLQQVKDELPWQHIMIFRAGMDYVLHRPPPLYHF